MLDVLSLGVPHALLTLSLRLLTSLPVVGDALLLPAVGFACLLALLFRFFSSFLPCCWVRSFGSPELLTY